MGRGKLNKERKYEVLSRFSHVSLPPPWTPLSMGFFRQEYWSGCCFLLQNKEKDGA